MEDDFPSSKSCDMFFEKRVNFPKLGSVQITQKSVLYKIQKKEDFQMHLVKKSYPNWNFTNSFYVLIFFSKSFWCPWCLDRSWMVPVVSLVSEWVMSCHLECGNPRGAPQLGSDEPSSKTKDHKTCGRSREGMGRWNTSNLWLRDWGWFKGAWMFIDGS